jgi:hypothetical protein
MTWLEPLTAEARPVNRRRFMVIIFTGGGQIIGTADCYLDHRNHSGYLHEILITDPAGGPRQVVRAVVLAIREAMRYGAENGIQRCFALVSPQLRDLVASLTDARERPRAGRYYMTADLATARTRLLARTEADGTPRSEIT